MKNSVLVVLLMSIACFGTNAATCSWGAWSQWDCTCCGNSINMDVYRVRTQCCSGTFACGIPRVTAKTITSIGADFVGKGQCLNDCTETDFKKHTRRCSSAVPTKNQTLLLATPDLCDSVCIGSLSTTKSLLPSTKQPTKTTVTHRDSTRVTDADVRSSTHAPPYSSHDTIPAENVTSKSSNKDSDRSLSTTKSSLPSHQQPPKTTVTHRGSTRRTDLEVRSSTHAPPYSSHDSVPAENVTTKYSIKDSDRSLSTTKSSLPSHQQPTKTTVTHRDSTRVTDADVRSSTHAPPYSSHDSVPAENVTTKYSIKDSEKNIASQFTVSSGPVLWIAVALTTVLCLLDLRPI